jgi:RNA polymerase sigma factor (sigma-70 family)
MGENTDSFQETLSRARQGYPTDVERIMALAQQELAAWATRNVWRDLRSIEESQDVLQEALLRVYRSLPQLQESHEDGFRRWLRVIAANTIKDQRRHFTAQRRNPEGEKRVSPPVGLEQLSFLPPASTTTPFTKASREERHALLRVALGQLDECDRSIITSRDYRGEDFDQIAKTLGYPSPDAARKAHRRAVIRLAKYLSPLLE